MAKLKELKRTRAKHKNQDKRGRGVKNREFDRL